ncbi:hypothetical protein RN001_006108 [Aquatica leii]|uniref:Protein SERAC1 n=1 Tax=Aquatica leii TaxID=1421715 RepID=A0AAN7PD78_9COLE|nr:hypothetical protein RN001_006108 [Aquatica leii]
MIGCCGFCSKQEQKIKLVKMEHDTNTNIEVEDIMCDQGIIKAELSMEIDAESSTIIDISATRFRLAITLLTRAVLPTVIEICYSCFRNQKVVLENVRRQILPTIFAFAANNVSRSLSTVQRGIFYPLLLRTPILAENDNTPEKCVECCVLHTPSDDESIVFDVIFIHGIHGSLSNTWKQGLWKNTVPQIKQAVLERSKSSYDLKPPTSQTSLKRSISDQFSNRPNKYSRIDNGICNESFDNIGEDVDYSKCWPKDWLAKDYPFARIIALNYTTDPYLWRPVWVKKRNRSNMVERCREMINHLLQLNVGSRPIVWVGHSKGGLYIKQIIVHAWEKNTDELRSLYLQSKGIMFYSVPHRGSILADFTLPFLRRSIELLEVQRNGYFVLNLHKKFLEMLEDTKLQPEIFSFFETSLTQMSLVYLRIVTPDSADIGVGTKWGVPLDHRQICKPSSKDCFLYQELIQLIENVLC